MHETTPAAATAGAPATPHRVVTSWEPGTSGKDHDLFVAEPVRGRVFRRPEQGTAHAGTVSLRPDGRYGAWHSTDHDLGTFDTDNEARTALESHALEERGTFADALAATPTAAWSREFCEMTGYTPAPAVDPDQRWAFRVERPRRPGDPSELWTMSHGTREAAVTASALADQLAVDARYGHSYHGPMTVTVWERRDEPDETRRPLRTGLVPDDAVVFAYGAGLDSRTAPLAPLTVPDYSDPTATDEDRLRWIATTLGPAPVCDPATDERMRPLYFVGGPWHGLTKYQPKAFVPQALFVWDQDGTQHTVSAPERDDDPRGRYQPTGGCDRVVMLWHVPGAPDPAQLVLTLEDADPYDRLALARIHERARESAGIAAAYGADGDDGLDHGINAAARPLVAAALHKLTALLPGITEDQTAWLDETAAALDLSVVEDLTGANGTEQEGPMTV